MSEFRVQPGITLVSCRTDLATLHGIADGATGFDTVGTIGEPAALAPRAKLREAHGEDSGREPPESDFAKAWRVSDESAAGKRVQPRTDRRVPPLVHGLTDRAHAQIETRIQRVEQRRFSDSGWPAHRRRPAGQRLAQLRQSLARPHTRKVHHI